MLRLSSYPLRWRNLRRLALSPQILEKPRVSRPADFDTLKSKKVDFGKVETEDIPAQKVDSKNDKLATIGGLVFIVALLGVIIKVALYPAFFDTKGCKERGGKAQEASSRINRILHEYKLEQTTEEYIAKQNTDKPNIFKGLEQSERAIPTKEWREAANIINPLKNYDEEKARVEALPEDPRSLEEIKANIERLKNRK